MTDAAVSRYLLPFRATEVYTHVSCIRPLGRYNFDRKGLEGLNEIYCETLFNNPDVVIGLAQMPREYSMVVFDADIKHETSNDPVRLYTYEQISNLITMLQSLLKRMVIDGDRVKDLFDCVLLEKDPYRDGKYVKSGFHLAFVNLFLPKAGQDIYLVPKIREEVEKRNIFAGLPRPNDVLDLPKSGAKPKPWLMYGSRKSPTGFYYKVARIYTSTGSVITGDELRDYFDKTPIYNTDGDEIKKSEAPDYYYPRIFSIHPDGRKTYEINGIFDASVSRTIFRQDDKKRREGDDDDDDEEEDETPIDPNFLKEIESLVEMLSPERVVSRDSWIEMGWIIYTITKGSQEGLKIWMTLSSMCPETFSENVCISEWSRMYIGGYTIKTLRYMAGIDNPDAYNRYQASKVKQHVLSAVDGSHNDLAKAMYEMYGQKYVCASIKPKIWYMFNGNNWVEMEEGHDLRTRISSDLVARFIHLCSETQQELAAVDDAEKSKVVQLDLRAKAIQKVIKNLKSSPFKNSVMKECEEVFYDPEFLGKLGKNKYLIAFQNGVYDLKLHCIRKGRPEDYLTLCMPKNYVPYSLQDADVVDVLAVLEKIFPDESVRKYFVDTTAEIFIGGNKRKLVSIWTGEGNNGKSIIKLLLQKLFGKYIIDLPTSVLVGPRTKAGSACPELARAGRGVRWVVAQEPNVREEINIGIVKELSGNDSFFIRTIYDKGGEITPLFKLALICNKLPRLPSDEQAIWNRIRVIPFEATFTSDYPEDPDEQLRQKRFPKDELLEDKLEGMAEAFGWYLLDTLRRNQDMKYVKEPPKVLAATEHYRKSNDVFAQYIDERLVKDEKGSLTTMNVFSDFRDWHRLSFPGFTIPIKQDCYEYLYSHWGAPGAGFKWTGWRIRTDKDDMKEGKVQVVAQVDWNSVAKGDNNGSAINPLLRV